MTTTVDPVVRELVLCATNEGSLYQEALNLARLDALGRGYDGYTGAQDWLRLCRRHMSIYRRTMADRSFDLTVAQWLAFAAALEDYYRDHLSEFNAEGLATIDKRLGV